MTYTVSVERNGIWHCVAAFAEMGAAIIYAADKTEKTGNYHLIEVKDGGKH